MIINIYISFPAFGILSPAFFIGRELSGRRQPPSGFASADFRPPVSEFAETARINNGFHLRMRVLSGDGDPAPSPGHPRRLFRNLNKD